MITASLRLGIGFDIEHNDDIIHYVGMEEGEEELAAFLGLIIKIPFISIYIGDFYTLE